jgi:HD-GYP domain-containing protein (c-di-GMP phosphodiesterase class II)
MEFAVRESDSKRPTRKSGDPGSQYRGWAHLRQNIILQYSIATFGIITVITLALGLMLTRSFADYQFRSHIRLYPEIVRLTVLNNPRLLALFDPSFHGPISPELEAAMSDFLSLGNVFRVKVWNPQARILWSDEKNLIGKTFPDNDEVFEAMSGVPAYEVGEAEKTENIGERDRGNTLQAYTPVLDAGKTVGVIELYEANRDLFAQIASSTLLIWLVIICAGIVLYCVLFGIFFSAYRRQKKMHGEIIETQNVTIFALAYQAELRDRETGQHLERTATYVRLLAERLSAKPAYRSHLTPDYIRDLERAAPLHDIGKVGVSDSILLKPGPLTSEERTAMERHSELGAQVLRMAVDKLKHRSFLDLAVQLTMSHHERWDGKGYPERLGGPEIPISARIMSLADNYDALRSVRVYKKSFTHKISVSNIAAERGAKFDPDIVDAFLEIEPAFYKISLELGDK